MSSSSRDFAEPSCTPPLAESPRRLEPPQLSRTPELTSRSLQRISDGFFLSSDVVNSDERYHLEPDNDDEWQRNLCSEPREYQSRRQPDISQKSMQGSTDILEWEESADMDFEKKKCDNEHEIQFSWTMGKNNLERVENVKHQPSSSGECPQENLTNGGFKLHGKQSVDGYTPDHEEYDKVEDDPSEDNAGGSHAHQEHPHSGSPYGQAGKPQEAYVVDPPTQGHKMRSFQNSSDPTVEIVAGSTDNPNLQSSRRANVVLYSEKTIDPVISSSLFGDEALHKLLGQSAKTSYWARLCIKEPQNSATGKGKSNEELEGLYVEFAENVANMRPSNGAANSVPSALSFEQIHPGSTSKVLELHKYLDDLNKQIAEERQEKQLIQKRFGDQHHEFERISRDKQELWEAKLRELQKDKYALQIRLQEVEAENPRQKIKRVGESVNLTEGELRRLRQEILEQEALIKGYQVENEKAVKKLKDIESTYKERAQLMAEENARLASQLANIQFAGCQTTIYGSTPNATKEIQALRTELFDLQSRETMLRLELEREKKNNQELGKSLATLNQDRENEVESLKQMLVKERLEHAQAVELKEEQTQLYLKSQDAVKALSKRLEDQDGIVADLRSKVEVFESQEEFGKENERDSRKPFQGQRNWSNIQKMKAIKRIEDLQKQVKKLEANLKLKNEHLRDNQQPLATSTDESEKVKSLQEEVRSLQHQIRDDNSRSVLQGLRHEHDQLKQEYSRVCAVTQQLKNQLRASAENDPSAAKKVKDLEKQVEDIRVFYIKKVRDLTRQLGDARKESSKMYTNMEARKTADKFNLKMNKLEETLAKRDAVIKKLQLKIKDLEAKKGGELPTSTSTEVASLRKQLEAAEIAREVLQKTCTETMERAALMSVQHQQMMRNVKEVHAMRVAGDRSCNRDDQEGGWQRKYKNQALEVENEVLESRVKDLSVELVDQTAQKSPRMAQLQFLRKRIEDMEARHKEREWEWQKILQDTRRLPSSKRQDKDEELWQMAYKAKYEEMESFKNEVDSVLEAALAFQNSQMENAEHKLFTRNDAKR